MNSPVYHLWIVCFCVCCVWFSSCIDGILHWLSKGGCPGTKVTWTEDSSHFTSLLFFNLSSQKRTHKWDITVEWWLPASSTSIFLVTFFHLPCCLWWQNWPQPVARSEKALKNHLCDWPERNLCQHRLDFEDACVEWQSLDAEGHRGSVPWAQHGRIRSGILPVPRVQSMVMERGSGKDFH